MEERERKKSFSFADANREQKGEKERHIGTLVYSASFYFKKIKLYKCAEKRQTPALSSVSTELTILLTGGTPQRPRGEGALGF